MATQLESIPPGRGGVTGSGHTLASPSPPVDFSKVSDAALEATASNVKRLKLAAEADVKYLENRLAKLRAEEKAALKEIERTRNQTAEFLSERKAHENREKSRREDARRREVERKRESAKLALRKEEQLQSIWSAKASLLKQRREAVEQLHRDSEMNRCRVRIEREDIRQKARLTRAEVQAQAEESRLRRQKAEEQRRVHVRKQVEAKVETDAKARVEMENKTAALVQEEAELIYRLKRMHMAKHKAVRHLALVMRITAAEQQETELLTLEAAVKAEDERQKGTTRQKPQPIGVGGPAGGGAAAEGGDAARYADD